eukprot:TRINITY_DN9748_c0_g1_i6.p2 TRINITY_DN9748_c0_g1~~TRINITY_DN9748_c0_g1_i6.p2  ORF type:complete len:287 (+),score=42.23 TRINITY_DN9748_c0_g1_i6:1332-2192(+)
MREIFQGMMLLSLLFFNILLTSKEQPFHEPELNQIETLSISVSLVTIYLGLFYINAIPEEDQTIFLIVLILINAIFFIYFIRFAIKKALVSGRVGPSPTLNFDTKMSKEIPEDAPESVSIDQPKPPSDQEIKVGEILKKKPNKDDLTPDDSLYNLKNTNSILQLEKEREYELISPQNDDDFDASRNKDIESQNILEISKRSLSVESGHVTPMLTPIMSPANAVVSISSDLENHINPLRRSRLEPLDHPTRKLQNNDIMKSLSFKGVHAVFPAELGLSTMKKTDEKQ